MSATTITLPPPTTTPSPFDIWLEDRLSLARSSPDQILAVVEPVTPALAAYLLGRNPANRPFKPSRVHLYAGMMERGEWELNGQSIIVARTGELNDGQNRLKGVIESGETVEMLFIFGVKRESRTSLDQGLNRSIGDILTMVGFTGGGDLGTLARYMIEFETHREIDIQQSLRPSRPQIIEYVGDHPELIDELGQFSRRAAGQANLQRALITFCRHIIETETGRLDLTPDFFERLTGGHDLKSNHPILTARDRLLRPNADEVLSASNKIELVFRAWNAMRRNDYPKQLMIKGGELPKLAV
jgi:hypothetical protein